VFCLKPFDLFYKVNRNKFTVQKFTKQKIMCSEKYHYEPK